MNAPRETPKPTRAHEPLPPEPIATTWADSELVTAHQHRKSLLTNCKECGKLSVELEEAIQQAVDAESKLTEVEALYNDALIKLNKIVGK